VPAGTLPAGTLPAGTLPVQLSIDLARVLLTALDPPPPRLPLLWQEKRTLYIPSDMVATVVGSSSGVKLLEELSGARIKVLATGLHGATRTADRAVVLTGTELQVHGRRRLERHASPAKRAWLLLRHLHTLA